MINWLREKFASKKTRTTGQIPPKRPPPSTPTPAREAVTTRAASHSATPADDYFIHQQAHTNLVAFAGTHRPTEPRVVEVEPARDLTWSYCNGSSDSGSDPGGSCSSSD